MVWYSTGVRSSSRPTALSIYTTGVSNIIVSHSCRLHQLCRRRPSIPSQHFVIGDLTTLPLYCWRCNLVQCESAEPGKDLTHLTGVETAGWESWLSLCADYGHNSENGWQNPGISTFCHRMIGITILPLKKLVEHMLPSWHHMPKSCWSLGYSGTIANASLQWSY